METTVRWDESKSTYVHGRTNICSLVNEHMFTGQGTYVLQKLVFLLLLIVAGGSAMAQGVRIHGSVFGGGNGQDAKVQTDTKVDISDGSVTLNVYGGGNQGNVVGNTEVNICAKDNGSGVYEAMNAGENGVTIGGDVYGGGKGSDENFFCNKAMVGNDGDGAGKDPGSDENKDKGTRVRIGNGTINGNVYGGGEVGRVEWNTQVMIGFGDGGNNASKPYIKNDVFGAGKGVSTHGFSALVRGNSTVIIQGDAQIGNNVYGGGQIATVGRYVVIDSRPAKPASGGLCTVNISGHANIGAENDAVGDVFGAGKGVLPYEGWGNNTPWSMIADGSHNNYPAKSASTADKADYFVFIQTLALASDTEVSIGGDVTVKGSVYGGSENGFLQRHTQVTIQGSSEIGTTSGTADVGGNIFGGGRGDDSVDGYAEAGKVKGNTNVTINGGIMHGTVYGGGEMGYTIGSATVNILSGTVNHDVYGGGALANTNTGRETNASVEYYVPVPGLTVGTSSVEGLYQNTYVPVSETEKIPNKQYYTADGTPITGTIAANPHDAGYYEWSETVYAASSGTAQAGKIYYTLIHPTTVNLFGGLIKGDAYGGGLGDLEEIGETHSDIAALVYGDVTVNLGNPTEADVDDARATAFELTETTGEHAGIAKSGRIFGCNNLNGSPKGAVTVNVYRTTALTNAGEVAAKPAKTSHADAETNPGTYELAAVYGGGNLAMYDPTNPETPAKVNIYGCGLTSIKQVYGGGNAAPVPGSEVMVEGTYEIYQVFGGGNGKDPYTLNGTTWKDNPGADVGIKAFTGTDTEWNNVEAVLKVDDRDGVHFIKYGNNSADDSKIGVAKISVLGGTIHYVFGGSNTKGDVVKNSWLVLGSENIQGCEYNVGKAYGGANDAPMSGDIVIEMGCTEGLDAIYGGARNADVMGNIVLNITGGHFGKVFGGNDNGGAVQGSITVNIEERSCLPIEIDELYGGGENAPYSIYGYKTTGGVIDKDENSRPTVLKAGDDGALATPYKNPQVNIISATRIGKIYGGGYGATATMVGDPHVNINMTQGTIDGKYEYRTGISDSRYNVNSEGYSYKDANNNPLVLTSTEQTASSYPKPLKLGNVGDVFGGGNAAEVIGDTYISIGTGEWLNRNEERVMLGTTTTITEPTLFTYNTDSKKWSYEGKDANNNTVTVSIDDTPTPSRNAAPITGNVYGGGNLADVTGNTQVVICATEGTGGTYQNVTTETENVSIAENVYGGGNGDENDVAKALVSGNTTIIMGGGSVEKSVYGGGRLAQVGGNANINVNGGTIGKDRVETETPGTYTYYGGAEFGNIYGAGQGSESGVGFGLVKGNTNINITDGTIYHNIYGGGAFGSVGDYNYDENDNITSINKNASDEVITGKASITITGGTIGTDGNNNGMVFGSSRGDIDAPDAIHDKLAWVYDTEVTIGTEIDDDGPTIHGSLYGGGENGHVYHDAKVMMYSGTVGDMDEFYAYRGNVYGGGCGTDLYYANPSGVENPHDGNGDYYNPKAGIVLGDATVEINGGSVANNVYGAGSMGKVGGDTHATINTSGYIGAEGEHDGGNVYGAARGEQNLADYIPEGDYANNYSTVTNSTVTLTNGTVRGSLFGGGKAGEVKGAVTVTLNGGTVEHDAYGGGALAQTNTAYDKDDDTYKTYVTNVTLNGATITGDLYGGGLGQKTGINEATSDIAANVGGPVTVTVTNGLATNVFGCNNINGSPQNTVTVNINGTNGTTADRPKPIFNVYGGGNQADYTYADPDNTQNLKVNISGGTMEYVFGGGLSADVAGGIDVTVSGGTVLEDVYGGGALANTNTANWNTPGSAFEYVKVTGLTTDTYAEKSVTVGESVVGLYVSSGGEYVAATGTAVSETTYYERTAGSSVAGYYTRTGSAEPFVYTLVTTGAAVANTDYYRKKVVGQWADNRNGESGTTYKTNVILKGGLIGNAYGGGLGRLYKAAVAAVGTEGETGYTPGTPEVTAVAAMVYGDVKITVNDLQANENLPGVAFTQNTTKIMYGEGDKRKEYIIPLTGRVFGCNNQNGTPTGNVKVEVYSTRQIDANNNIIPGHGSSNSKYPNEMQAVYGGGNLSDYLPADGKGTSVYIEGCDVTSIEKVYGGGNSASVPATDVTIESCYDIGYAFGGGNGGDLIYKDDEWIENEGAIVIGLAKITPKGGKIGQVFGGSDAKGVCGNTTVDLSKQDESDCDLVLTRIYGAGNEADVSGDVNMIISGCSTEQQTIDGTKVDTQIEYVYGGSYNAHITGHVTLTITSGTFKYVYGGNDRTGSIGGNITVNIEERDDCKPIIIENLLGGGNEAAFPGTNRAGTEISGTGKKITVNVKSATYIGSVYGGSYKADVNGDTEVNINMTKGLWAGAQAPAGHSDLPNINHASYAKVVHPQTANIGSYYEKSGDTYTKTSDTEVNSNKKYYVKVADDTDVIDDAVGIIGTVFGGGNQGVVRGNAVVNIGTSQNVQVINTVTTDDDGKITNITYDDTPVLGAHIAADVYGGGNLADVLGNTYVNICAKENSSNVYEAVAEGTDHVTIAGNVYGGGKGADDNFFCDKGMVGVNNTNNGSQGSADLGTHVHIGNGTVNGSVYGGGEVGRVEFHSVVTIGLTPQTGVATSAPEVLGNVFGGGKGVETHGYAALLRGHTNVTVQQNAKVRNSVYGGGEIATIGRFWIKNVNNKVNGVLVDGATEAPDDLPDGMPYALRDGGTCTVDILGNAEIGPTTQMTMPQFEGNVFGAGKGFLPRVYDYTENNDAHRPKRTAVNGDDYFKDEAAYMVFIETQALVNETHVTIDGNAFVKGSVYGGSENGRVLNDTYVTIAGGQIGAGKDVLDTDEHPRRYTTAEWEYDGSTEDKSLAECPSWQYDNTKGEPYDPFATTDGGYNYTGIVLPSTEQPLTSSEGGKPTATDGHTYYGNVFGGGCGKDPYKPGKWHRKAGAVGGNTTVTITGGHILTSLYGGNEMTDVGTYTNNTNGDPIVPASGGKCTINMTGGTLGVPRTLTQIAAHPVTCYLFGSGKGDTRTFFNTWTNVIETEVNITGTARIYGSVFGGGEDGHIMNDAEVNIGDVKIDETSYNGENVKIGTTGTSYVDGNVFGGGRGFTGEALTAGSTGGNVRVNISNGLMMGSIYGGGRLASVGIAFTSPNELLYGQLVDDTDDDKDGVIEDNEKKHGHISINISGGTIGTTTETGTAHPVGGNVFGGSMGRITLLNGDINPLWPKLAVVKEATINISGGEIKNSVYGGSEYGIVRDKATVNVLPNTTPAKSPVIWGNIYGGGYGSDDETHTLITAGDYATGTHYIFTPMIWTGCVAGDTEVNISGGTMKKNIYGGGELASVGLINCNVEEDDENGDIIIGTKKYRYTAMIKHDVEGTGSDEKAYRFALSWPYEFNYISGNPTTGYIGGKSSVTISGGTIGIENDTEEKTGYVFGGGKGKVVFGTKNIENSTEDDISKQRYAEAFCANVRETHVTIEEGANVRTVYGGGDDGHVEEDANVIINGGTITHSVFGGGKGTSTYKAKLLNATTSIEDEAEDVHSWTAGKVYGNTNVTMNDGNVGWFIYGGGNLASVGKGNYSGGQDDYSTGGYGELPSANGNLWTTAYTAQNPTKDMAYHFLNSGIAKVNIYGGTLGKVGEVYSGFDSDGIPRGSVFGGSRGKAAKTEKKSPRYKYVPDFFLGYVNKTEIKIGKKQSDFTQASDYNTYTGPTIYGSVYAGGQDGHVRNSTELKVYKAIIDVQGNDDAGRSGHIFGAGSGIGKYHDASDNKDKLHYGSGSVTCTTFVEVNDGAHIVGNVYGGGAMATVGPPKIPPTRPDDEQKEVTSSSTHQSCSYTQVDINGGSIGGSVFGASRGPSVSFYEGNFETPTNNLTEIYDSDQYATSIWSTVNINGGEIAGNVYGGGEGGCVKNNIVVNLKGGTITNDAYGGGKGHKYIAADVGGNVTLELNNNNNGADADGTKTGCIVKRIFGCNDVNGTPKGHVLVHVYATQHPNTTAKQHIEDKYDKYGNVTTYTAASDLTAFATAVGMTETERTPYETAITNAGTNDKAAKIEEYRNAISLKKYDVEAVYGGGNLAAYEPTDASATDEATKEAARTEVIIDGCELTSIKQVYGGSNAASTPATLVRVNEAYEIDEIFGGGNGKDMYQDPKDNKWYKNPGANVGYKDFTEKGTESGDNEANAISQTDNPLYDTAEERLAATSLHYGSGITNIIVTGGRIHMAYGGSNSRGNIRTKATSLYQESGTCTLDIDKTYGAGKDADTDAQVVMNMDCVTNMDQLFGGSTNADVNNDIYLTVTNGTYNQVFGGNDTNGAIHGSITVEIKENGCTPIEIKELYAGGYLAPYSVYGYKKTNGTYDKDESGRLIPLKADDEDAETKKLDPHINVISATKIGDIYGGGYKADVVGSPHINVNMTSGRINLKKVEVTLQTKTANDPDTYVFDENRVYKDDSGNTYNKDHVFTDNTDNKIYVYASGANESYDPNVNGNVQTETTDEGTNYYHTLTTGYIGNIFGGGNEADIYGSTYIDIGTGKWIERTRDEHGVVSETAEAEITPTRNKADLFVDNYIGNYKPDNVTGSGGYVFGGGNQGIVKGNTYITMGNGAMVGNSIFGGGNLGSVGTFTGDADHRNYSFKDTDGNANGPNNPKNTGICNVTINGGIVGPESTTETIPGNVFGGGRGSDTDYYCEEAMAYATNVNISNGTVNGNVYGGGKIARLENNTSVTIGLSANGTTTYYRKDTENTYTAVTPEAGANLEGLYLRSGEEDSYTYTLIKPEIKGNVFGAGKGLETHGYSALVRGNPSVTVQGNAKVRGSVYGGGEIASVARYKVVNGSPVAVDDPNSGTCTVIVKDYAEIGPDNMQMTKDGGPDDTGHVFGAGKGVLPKVYAYGDNNANRPKRMLAAGTALSSEDSHEAYTDDTEKNIWEYFGSDKDYHAFIETLALSSNTNVTIGGHAFVKGSVYGGSENGIVQYNTHVTIDGDSQIGNGDGVNRRYTADEWAQGKLIPQTGDPESVTSLAASHTNSLPECAHWDYNSAQGAPYDPFATSNGTYDYSGDYSVIPNAKRRATTEGGKQIATDGHTYYGNVYGGGSGVVPYAPGLWHRAAGQVRGNTQVDITGGHILTSVYGGNEHTDVGIYTEDTHHELTVPKSGGKCTVNMTGGTLGVPRTLAQIAAHPVTCYLFGAGKGDQRIFFNTWTNVKEVEVNVTGNARIFGSVFGGGEDGHVIKDVKLNIKNGQDVTVGTKTYRYPYIGMTGTSYVDGNVFGAGRGYSGEAITAGSIGGNIEVKISDGTMLGSIYGGGRLASVGIGFNAVTDASYGQFTEDVAEDVHYTQAEIDEAANDESAPAHGKTTNDVKIPAHSHGHITVDISGGIIGNDLEDLKLKQESNYHTKGGNVYGGSMGRLELLDGTTPNPLWPQLGQAKTTTVKISGTALIKSNVYGGGEMGTVRDNTNIIMSGGTVNRDVYGGGYGSDKIGENYNATVETEIDNNTTLTFGYNPMKWAGMVGKETNIEISGGRVKKSVYGGGEMASVGIINYTLKPWHETEVDAKADGNVVFKIKTSENPETYKYAAYATIEKHVDETSSFALSWPYKVEYMPEYDGKTNVTITGGRIGLTSVEDEDDNNPFFEKDNGDVYGGGKGIAGDFNDYLFCANVGSSEITINYPTDDDPTNDVTPENYMSSETIECVAGAVYGGAENGHVMGDTKVTLTNGLIGHSLYGGGSGKGQYTTTLARIPNDRVKVVENGVATQATYENGNYDATIYSITAGKVFGNTKIEMTGGQVVRNIYGGGNMGSVGKGNYAGGPDDYSTAGYGEKIFTSLWPVGVEGQEDYVAGNADFLNSGKCTVKVTGGTVGYINESNPNKSMYPLDADKNPYDASLPYGNIFGGCRGEAAPNILETPRYLYSPEFFLGYANETEVTIGTIGQSNDEAGKAGKAPLILGSVYGGGQDGHVRRDTHVTVNSGEIGLPFSDNYRAIFGKTSSTTLNEELDNLQWLARGNVYGAGSGIGKYKYDFNYDGNFVGEIDYTTPSDRTSRLKEEDNSASAGSVTRFTQVEIHGGIIHRNVYGGGSMASVGAPMIGQGYLPYRKGDTTEDHGVGKQTLNQVNIAGMIGTPTNYNPVYGGEVYGASRGVDANNTSMATSIWTEVNLLPGAYVQGNVFGGGDNGMVKQDAEVNVGTPWTATIQAGNVPLSTGGSKTITITTKDKWTVTSDVDWLTINPSSGEGNGTITVTAPAAGAAREAKVTITGTGRSQTFTITQE